MEKKRSKFYLPIAAIFISVLFLNGCTNSRLIVDAPMPVTSTGEDSQSNGKEIYINSIVDKRIFEINPLKLSALSIDPTDEQGDNIKNRTIGRDRNSYNMALGNIVLPEEKTVDMFIAAALRQALLENGYKIITEKEHITKNTTILDVQIQNFWVFMDVGVWTSKFGAEITTEIAVKNNGKPVKKIVLAAASLFSPEATQKEWRSLIEQALKKYVTELKLNLP